MRFKRHICASLVLTLGALSTSAQVQIPADAVFFRDDRGRDTMVSLSVLDHDARAGTTSSVQSAYFLAHALELGEGRAGHRPDLDLAAKWYLFAASRGSVKASYRLGELILHDKVSIIDKNGVARLNSVTGLKLINWALANGYLVATDTVNGPPVVLASQQTAQTATVQKQQTINRQAQAQSAPSSSATSDSALGGLLLLGGLAAIVAVAASANSSEEPGKEASQGSQGCWVQDPYFDSEAGFTKYRSRFAFPCPN